jgi:hypothetical protein
LLTEILVVVKIADIWKNRQKLLPGVDSGSMVDRGMGLVETGKSSTADACERRRSMILRPMYPFCVDFRGIL